MSDVSKNSVGETSGIKNHFIADIFSVCVSLIALFFSLLPQTIPWNTNLLDKANAGHNKSQFLLAEHYYETHEISDSLYWYKIAATRKNDHQAKALNNMAIIYATESLSEYYRAERQIKAYTQFLYSWHLGSTDALKNAYILLHDIPSQSLEESGFSFLEEQRRLEGDLRKEGLFSSELSSLGKTLEYVDTISSLDEFHEEYNSGIYHIETTSQAIFPSEEIGMAPQYLTQYEIYKIIPDAELPPYTFLFYDDELA